MNWGYIFFKYEDDAEKFIAENEGAALTSYTEVRQQALERRKAKMNAQAKESGQDEHQHEEDDNHSHGEGMSQTNEQSEGEGHNE